MNDNRFEEVEKKENGFAKAMKYFGTYLKNLGYDIVMSFKYNNMKLAGLLVGVPGAFIGFLLHFHVKVINAVTFGSGANTYVFSFDYTGIMLFLLMLFGILNLFTAAQMIGKRNRNSVIMATITSSMIIICGALYLTAIIVFFVGASNGSIKLQKKPTFDINYIVSIGSVVISMATSIAGCVLGYINYDRTWEKADR